jgi:hypothetical protein
MTDEFQYRKINEALSILHDLGMPEEQRNERSALCLLALLDLSSEKQWDQSSDHLIGITTIITWIRKNYGKDYAPNSRETIRRFSIHQFIEAGLVIYNPDQPDRPTNSPHTVYKIEPTVLNLLKSFSTSEWNTNLHNFLQIQPTLIERYARDREQNRVPVWISQDKSFSLSPGIHNELIRDVIEEFAQRFVPGSKLIYAGDTGEKWGYFDKELLSGLGVEVDSHGKMPDVVLFYPDKGWLVLVESVTHHGPVDGKRHAELSRLFSSSSAGLVYVTAFPDRNTMSRYLNEIAWETEVWVAEAPSHLIHFNGERFLGPY